MLQAWTEVYHQNFGGWEMQTMLNLQKNVYCEQRNVLVKKFLKTKLDLSLLLRAWVEKTVPVETHWFSGKEKFRAQRPVK